MTSASHAEGRQFDPGQVYFHRVSQDRNDRPCLAITLMDAAAALSQYGPGLPNVAYLLLAALIQKH